MNQVFQTCTNRNDICRSLVHSFRIFQRMNRFVTEDMNSTLSILESLLLYELDSDPTRSITELAQVMEMDKTTISRTLKSMASRKILRIGKDPNDARRITIEILALGYKILEKNDDESNELLRWYLHFLSEQEQSRLTNYFKKMADAFGTAPSLIRKNDFEIRLHMRRLAKSLGYLKETFLGMEYSPAQWQVIATIATTGETATPAFLSNLLSTPSSYMSRLLTGLVNQGLVRRPRDSEDSRMRNIYLTDKGKAVYKNVENRAASYFEQKLSGFSDEELSDFLKIFHLYIREPMDGVRLIDRHLCIQIIHDDESRKLARGFLLRTLVQCGRENDIPAEVCTEKDLISILIDKDGMKGILVAEPHQSVLKAKVWFSHLQVNQVIKELWKNQMSALITDYIRGFPMEQEIDSSSYIGNI